MEYIKYAIIALLENVFLEFESIYYEFLLQTERTHKLVKYPTKIDDFNTGYHKLIVTFFL